jgi:uncharacterized membrane protein YebE (DUF533 family)
MTHRLNIALLAALAAVSFSAAAQNGPHQGQQNQGQQRQQGQQNGQPRPNEHAFERASPQAMFHRADTNGDGMLSEAEMRAFHEQHQGHAGQAQNGQPGRDPSGRSRGQD